jgi:hypothetical protein
MLAARENYRRVGFGLIMAVALLASLIWLPLGWTLVIAAFWCLTGVVRLRRPALRNACLATASLLLATAAVDLGVSMLAPTAPNVGVVKIETPQSWYPQDPAVGFSLRPNTTVAATARYGDELLYRVTYHIDAQGSRVVPGSTDTGPTWLFIGDSYMFSEGVEDEDTLPSQFARRLRPAAHVVNLGVPGYGPNNYVRAMELGLYDKYVVGAVKAVLVWATPSLLWRVTGDASWLGSSPRYDFADDGTLQWSGSFEHYRWTHPWEGVTYYARTNVALIDRAMQAGLERRRTKLYVALMARLAELVEQRYHAPLIVLSNGPEKEPANQVDLQYLPAFEGLRSLGVTVLSVRNQIQPLKDWSPYFIPHDGHPKPRLNALVTDLLVGALDLPTGKAAR